MSYGNGYGRQYGDGGGFNLGARLIPIVIGLIAIGFTMVRGCQHGPFGRNQIVAIQPDQEAQLGLQAFKEVLKTSHVVHNGPAVEAVHHVTDRLIKAVQSPEFQKRIGTTLPKFDWELEVVDDKQVNAFCLPGGKIVVYTGILPVAVNDAGLATVIGHEISHALAHHGAERMAQQQIASIGMTAAGASIGDMDPGKRQQVMQVLNAGAQFGILKYSRGHESEADHMGLLLMAAAGYDPSQAIEFWKRMEAATGSQGAPPEFMSTHPSHGTRVHDLKAWLPEAMPLYENSPYKSEKLETLPGASPTPVGRNAPGSRFVPDRRPEPGRGPRPGLE
ncbi:MAG: family peptidase [Schlesneria sp.]|nr:family peptidase [Schlesneria sp.]